MIFPRLLHYLALAVAFIATPANPQGSSVTNTGSCTIIIQGSNNTANLSGACDQPKQPGQTILRSRYQPYHESDTDFTVPTIIRDDFGSFQRLIISFAYPFADPHGEKTRPADTINVYAYRITADDRWNAPSWAFPDITGNWNPGDYVKMEIDVPTHYFEDASGWYLRYCIKSVGGGCYPSPNLLNGVRF